MTGTGPDRYALAYAHAAQEARAWCDARIVLALRVGAEVARTEGASGETLEAAHGVMDALADVWSARTSAAAELRRRFL